MSAAEVEPLAALAGFIWQMLIVLGLGAGFALAIALAAGGLALWRGWTARREGEWPHGY